MDTLYRRGGHHTGCRAPTALGTFERVDLPDIFLGRKIFGSKGTYCAKCNQHGNTGATPDEIPPAVLWFIFHFFLPYLLVEVCIAIVYRNLCIEVPKYNFQVFQSSGHKPEKHSTIQFQ